MTVAQMIDAVNIGVDKTSSFQTVSFEEEEILYGLNLAQEDILKQKMFGNNFRKETYDTLHGGLVLKRSDDISNLIRYSDELTYDESNVYPDFRPHRYHPNVAVVNINSTTMPHYLYYIGADFKVTMTPGVLPGDPGDPPGDPGDPVADNLAPMETVVIEQKDIGDFVETPTNKPYLRNGYVYLKEGEVNVIYDPFVTPVWLYVSYVLKPKKLVLVADPNEWEADYTDPTIWDDEETSKGLIPEHVHSEIVALTVNSLLENVADPRYKSHSIELTKKE